MGWSFPGISYPVELVYTQSLGVLPGVAVLRFLPQVGSVPVVGTMTLTWGATTVTLPNCVSDLASLRIEESGRYMQMRVFDRRERWKKAAAVSGEYNVLRAGGRIRSKNIRELARLLFDAIGETTAVISALPTDVYPPVSWKSDDAIEAIDDLLTDAGYSVALGYGSEPVTVVRLGTGSTLPTTSLFTSSDTVDPKFVPRYVKSHFGDTIIQGRLKLQAVSREPDGSWVPIADSSYKPADGWEKTPPYSLSPAAASLSTEQLEEAVAYVRRAYRVIAFADDTLDRPDTGDPINAIEDIFPLFNRLLQTEDVRADTAYQPYRVYGKYTKDQKQETQPQTLGGVTTDIGDLVQLRRSFLDGENGLLIFEDPIYYVQGGDYKPAELWLETTFRVRNQNHGAWDFYDKSIEVVPTGTGYHNLEHEERLEVIMEYDTSHAITGSTSNEADLDTQAAAWAAAVIATYATTQASFAAYNQPVLTLRCDGAIQQVTHIMTAGETQHAVNRTLASRNYEYDRSVPSRSILTAHLRSIRSGKRMKTSRRQHIRRTDADE